MSDIKATDVVQFNLTGALLMLIAKYQQEHEASRSLAFVIEESLLAGVQAKQRSKEYSEQTKNRKEFEKQIAADPTVVLDPKRMTALLRKYKMGGLSNPATPASPLATIEAALGAAASPAPASEVPSEVVAEPAAQQVTQ